MRSRKKSRSAAGGKNRTEKYIEVIDDEIDRQTKDIERPGEERSDQFIVQEEMKKASFRPKRRPGNPL